MMIILETIHKICASSHKEALVVVDATGTECNLALLCEMDFDEFCQIARSLREGWLLVSFLKPKTILPETHTLIHTKPPENFLRK